MTASPEPDSAGGSEKTYNLSGDFRGAIINIESTFVGAAQARDIEQMPPEPGEPPFKGLQYFTEADADRFFGRELLTARLVGRLGSVSFLAVIGASGSGKSSVVRAGVLPALRRGQRLADGTLPPADSAGWAIHVLTPTAHPLDALASSLLRDNEPVASVVALRDQLAADPGTLAVAGRQLLARQDGRRLLLVVDQFEEVFSLCRQESERRAFIDNLVRASSEEGSPVTVLIVLRADFYAHCAQYDGLRELVSRQQEYIGAMTRDELFRAIVQPAALGDWKFQEGLVELMLDDVGDEPGALPLLSHALLETWSRRRGRTMTLSAYKESGGVRGAIAKTAESVFQQRLTPEQRPVARMIFVRLTELGEGGEQDTPDTRRRAQFSELITRATDAPTLEAVLGILIDSRLVTADIIPPGETKVVEVAHEALIREWPTLRDWLNQDREALIRHRQLTEDVNDWVTLDRDPGALYRGARLAQTLAWVESSPDPLSLIEQEFLEASQAAAAREQRARLTQRGLVVASVVLLGLAILAGLMAFDVVEFNPAPDLMSGDFNIAVAEFAVFDQNGALTNDTHDGGRRIAERIGTSLQTEFSDQPEVQVWYDSRELEQQHHVEIGVVGPDSLGLTEPADAAEELNADMIVYGVAEPDGELANLKLRFYLRPQFGADFSQMVGTYEFNERIPIFDTSNPREEVWRQLDPLANALALVVLGLRQEILGEQDAAAQFLQRAADLAPESDVIQYMLGQENFYAAQRSEDTAGRLEAAEAAFGEALRLNPDNPRARIGQGSVHFLRAQRMLNRAVDMPAGPGRVNALSRVQEEAQLALDAYTAVAGQGEQLETYGVPVASIARLGQAISHRVLAQASYESGDAVTAEGHIDQAATILEGSVDTFDTDNDPRLYAQMEQALGSIYEWKAFLLTTRGATNEAATAASAALEHYQACVQQGQDYPIDTYLVDRIVEQLCLPRVEALQQPAGGG